MHDGNESRDNHGVSVRKRRKGIYILPNLFTLAALFGGFYSVEFVPHFVNTAYKKYVSSFGFTFFFNRLNTK